MGASLAHYIGRVADSIENGTDFMYFRPLVDDGRLHWDVVDLS